MSISGITYSFLLPFALLILWVGWLCYKASCYYVEVGPRFKTPVFGEQDVSLRHPNNFDTRLREYHKYLILFLKGEEGKQDMPMKVFLHLLRFKVKEILKCWQSVRGC